MRPIQICLSISKKLHDSGIPDLDDRIFREAAEMLGRKLLEDGILERHLEPDINRPEFHYILVLNRKDLPEPKEEKKLPEGLEEAAYKYADTICPVEYPESFNDEQLRNAFKSGAEWGAEHLKK